MNLPPALHSGDAIRIVAPSGPFDEELLRSGLERLARYDIQVPDRLMGRQDGFLAGSDEERLNELQAALDCPDAKAIWVARGGYGLARIAPHLSWEAFRRFPKWVVGFSDVTALHQDIAAQGYSSLHAANGTTLARLTGDEFDETIGLLEAPSSQDFSDLETWSAGTAAGPLCGGNLTVLFAEAAAGRLHFPDGAILFLEDVTETSYRIDRMLNALQIKGHLSRAAGIVFGEFLDCSPGKFGVPTKDVLRRAVEKLGVPVLAGAPVGHGKRNRPLLLGAEASLQGNTGTMEIRLPSDSLGA